MRVLLLVFSFYLFIFASSDIYASVVINEVSSSTSNDWVELFSPEDLDISGYILDDLDGEGNPTSTNIEVVPNGTWIGPNTSSFYVFDTSKVGNRLNNNGDIVSLYLPDGITVVDSIAYGNRGGPCTPTAEGSIGRYNPELDGSNLIERLEISSMGSTNTTSSLFPCPTPTSEPTNTPMPSPTQKPTITPTTKPVATLKPTLKPAVKTEEKIETENSIISKQKEEGNNLAELRYAATPTTSSPNSEVKGATTSKIPLTARYLIVLGLIFIAGSIFAFFRNKKKSLDTLQRIKSVDDSEVE